MTFSHWRIFTDTSRPDAAKRLVNKLQSRSDRQWLQISLDDYHKGGHIVAFEIEHEFNDWPAVVYDAITCAQQMGYSWSISGSIDEEVDLMATDTFISGINMITGYCANPGALNAK